MAPRYASARPDVHSGIVAYLQRVLGSSRVRGVAFDVGCGTGLSARPLRALADAVVGLDPSPSMLREASRQGRATYVIGRAEALPFRDAACTLVTAGCAYHWCDPSALLSEALRVLAPGGHLAIYDNWFLADRPRSTRVYDWLDAEHWSHLPKTPRNPLPELGAFPDARFDLVDSCFLDAWIRMSRDGLVRYLTTQSGVVAAVESKQRTLMEIEARLRAGLARLVPDEGADFHFGGPIWVVRPAA